MKYALKGQKKIPTLDRDCAAKEIRTPTPFQALPPQGSASTNFAIAAVIFNSFILIKEVKDNLIGLKFEIILIKPRSRGRGYLFKTILKVVPFPGSLDFTYKSPL